MAARSIGVAAALAVTLIVVSAQAEDKDKKADKGKPVPKPTAGQKLALQTKPSVVRVIAGYMVETPSRRGTKKSKFYGGHGSGFFVDPSGYVATNAHVVRLVHMTKDKAREEIAKNIVRRLIKRAKLTDRDLRSDRFRGIIDRYRRGIRLSKKVMVVVLPNGDKLPYDIKAYGTPVSTESVKDVAILKVQTKNAPTLLIGDDATVQIQDRLFAFGYPGAADDLASVLDKRAVLEATITTHRPS